MSTPTKITVHQDIFEEALKQANERGTKVGLYCKSLVSDHSTKAKIKKPEGYEHVHSQTGRGLREKDLQIAKIQFRVEHELLEKYRRIAEKQGLRVREAMRLVITEKVLKATKQGV
jgi:hypothetical protein